MAVNEIVIPAYQLMVTTRNNIANFKHREVTIEPAVLNQLSLSDFTQLLVGWIDYRLLEPRLLTVIKGLPESGRWYKLIDQIVPSGQDADWFRDCVEIILEGVLSKFMGMVEAELDALANNHYLVWRVEIRDNSARLVNLGDYRIIEWTQEHIDVNGRYHSDTKKAASTTLNKPAKPMPEWVRPSKIDEAIRVYKMENRTTGPEINHEFQSVEELTDYVRQFPDILEHQDTYRVRVVFYKGEYWTAMMRGKLAQGSKNMDTLNWEVSYAISKVSV